MEQKAMAMTVELLQHTLTALLLNRIIREELSASKLDAVNYVIGSRYRSYQVNLLV